jgi:hypothetical protein
MGLLSLRLHALPNGRLNPDNCDIIVARTLKQAQLMREATGCQGWWYCVAPFLQRFVCMMDL